jgi:hypothetical protein
MHSYFELWAWDGTLAHIRDGAALVLTKVVRRRFPFIKTIFADAGY